MRISSITIYSWQNGAIQVSLEESTVNINLTEEESERFRRLGVEIFISRQKALAHEIENAGPVLLADFSEVEIPPPVPVRVNNDGHDPYDDDMPF